MSDVIRLDAMPAASGLYLRALTPGRRPAVTDGLPDRLVTLPAHRSSVAEVAAYDTVCGFGLTDRLPATWLHVLTFPLQLTLMTAADFPLAAAGMVHLSNTITQHRPASLTQPLDLSVRAEHLRPHRRGVLVDLVGEARVDDELVWEGRSVYLNRSASLPGEVAPEPERDRPQDLTTAALWRLPADLGRRYAAVSGDVNPIHLNPVAAKAFGFPRAIAHGMWTHARTLAALDSRLPPTFTVTVDFTKPVLLPSTVRFAVTETADGYAAQLTNKAADKVFLNLSINA